MNLKEALHSCRAVRMYEAMAVDEKTIQSLIDASIQAPNAVNEQPWSFTVVCARVPTGRGLRGRLL